MRKDIIFAYFDLINCGGVFDGDLLQNGLDSGMFSAHTNRNELEIMVRRTGIFIQGPETKLSSNYVENPMRLVMFGVKVIILQFQPAKASPNYGNFSQSPPSTGVTTFTVVSCSHRLNKMTVIRFLVQTMTGF